MAIYSEFSLQTWWCSIVMVMFTRGIQRVTFLGCSRLVFETSACCVQDLLTSRCIQHAVSPSQTPPPIPSLSFFVNLGWINMKNSPMGVDFKATKYTTHDIFQGWPPIPFRVEKFDDKTTTVICLLVKHHIHILIIYPHQNHQSHQNGNKNSSTKASKLVDFNQFREKREICPQETWQISVGVPSGFARILGSQSAYHTKNPPPFYPHNCWCNAIPGYSANPAGWPRRTQLGPPTPASDPFSAARWTRWTRWTCGSGGIKSFKFNVSMVRNYID